jgi:hypothetical protein
MVQGFRLRGQGLRFRVHHLGRSFRFPGSEFSVLDSEFGGFWIQAGLKVHDLTDRFEASRFSKQGSGCRRVWGSGFGVQRFGGRIQVLGNRVLGSGSRFSLSGLRKAGPYFRFLCSELGTRRSGFQVPGFRVQISGSLVSVFLKQGSRFWVHGSGL